MPDNKKILIAINATTKARLEKLKHPGQTWNGVIEELLDKLQKETVVIDVK